MSGGLAGRCPVHLGRLLAERQLSTGRAVGKRRVCAVVFFSFSFFSFCKFMASGVVMQRCSAAKRRLPGVGKEPRLQIFRVGRYITNHVANVQTCTIGDGLVD